MKFPSDETGRNRKLSQPWHGPYRILDVTDTNVTVEKVYRTKDDKIHVHKSRVTFLPQYVPPGYYWYGPKHCCPGKPPQWVETLTRVTDHGDEQVPTVDGREEPEVNTCERPAAENVITDGNEQVYDLAGSSDHRDEPLMSVVRYISYHVRIRCCTMIY